MLSAIVNQAPHDPREYRPELTDDVVKFLLKSIERDPRNRFQRPADFREALEQLSKKW